MSISSAVRATLPLGMVPYTCRTSGLPLRMPNAPGCQGPRRVIREDRQDRVTRPVQSPNGYPCPYMYRTRPGQAPNTDAADARRPGRSCMRDAARGRRHQTPTPGAAPGRGLVLARGRRATRACARVPSRRRTRCAAGARSRHRHGHGHAWERRPVPGSPVAGRACCGSRKRMRVARAGMRAPSAPAREIQSATPGTVVAPDIALRTTHGIQLVVELWVCRG